MDKEAQKQELSCVNVIPIILYLEASRGREETASIVELLGLPLTFLRNKHNWVSYSYYNRLLDKLVEVSGDERAPFKVPFIVKPQAVFEYMLYATYTTLWSGSPKLVYKISLGTDFYKRWTKTGEFRILSMTANSMKLKLTLKKGFEQTRNNCLMIQGLLSFLPTGMNLPPAHVKEIQCMTEGADSCVYQVTWQNKRKWAFIVGLPSLAIIVLLELTLLKSFFGARDVIITALVFLAGHFSIQSYQFWKSLKSEEKVNLERNEHLMKTMKHIEEDYEELLDIKAKLEERNVFLSVINEVSENIAETDDFETLLLNILGVIISRLRFTQGDFFLFNRQSGIHTPLFRNNGNFTLSQAEYADFVTFRNVLKPNDFGSGGISRFANWVSSKGNTVFYIVPLTVPEIYSGFYCFLGEPSTSLSGDLAESLFENIVSQLKTGLAKIASTTVITNILSSIPAYVIIFDAANLTVEYANKFFVEFFPVRQPTTRIPGRDIGLVLGFDESLRDNIEKSLTLLEKGERPGIFETSVGSSIYEYSVFAIPRFTLGKKLAGLILSDVSEAKYFHEKLLFNEELLALGRVASGIAHEINNPLYAVLANAEEIAEEENVRSEIRGYATEIVEHVINVSNIIKDLSKYSKSLRKPEKDNVNINDTVEESLKLVRYSMNFLEITIEKNLTPLPEIKARKGEIQQIFINLFHNAIQAMDGKGTLSISTIHEGGEIRITVSDTGVGIRDDDLPRIFDLFFTTKKAGEGTGQGLHIVKKIINAYNGKIDVTSSPGTGTTFNVSFKAEN